MKISENSQQFINLTNMKSLTKFEAKEIIIKKDLSASSKRKE